MRSVRIPILALILAVAGFFAYWHFLGDTVKPPQTNATPIAPTTRISTTRQTALGDGKRVWIKQYDATATKLVRQFRAAEYSPQKDGSLICVEPEAVFYLADGQELHLSGERGKVHVDSLTQGGNIGTLSQPSQPPNRGRIFGVVLTLTQPGQAEPLITMTLNNVAFDTEMMEIHTEGYTDQATGQTIEPDQVPVVMRGEYEFDGRGLLIRWNDRDHQLQLLEVKHGGRMLIRNPSKFGKSFGTFGADSPRSAGENTVPAMLASADPTDAALALPANRPANVMYRAIFRDQVKIEQAEQLVVTADVMHVDFTPRKDQDKKPAPATAPTTSPSTAPATNPSAATTEPTTQPAAADAQEKPVIITWAGPLRIVPQASGPTAPLPPGECSAKLKGTPVVMHRDGGEARAAELVYQSMGKRFELRGDGELPTVTFKDDRGATVEGERVDIAMDGGEMNIDGKSHATIPIDNDEHLLEAHWSRRGTLHFAEAQPGQKPLLRLVQLIGDVRIDYPELVCKSQNLELAFDEPRPGEKPAIKNIRAWEGALCTIKAGEKQESEIAAQSIEVQTSITPARKTFATSLKAQGDVRAKSEGRELASEKLEMGFVPSADAKKTAIDSMHAQTRVRVTLRDGSTAKCDDLKVQGRDENAQITITSADRATISDRDGNILTGRDIRYAGSTQTAEVIGPGTLRRTRDESHGVKQMPVDLSWSEGMEILGRSNRIEVRGNVVANTADSVDSKQTVTAQLMHVALQEVASTQPASRLPATSQPVDADAITLSNRRIRQIEFEKEVTATLVKTREELLLQKITLLSSKMQVDPDGQRIEIPVPGKMLIEGDEDGPKKPGDPLAVTAIQWKDHLLIDKSQSVFEAVGDVAIAHTNPGDHDAVQISASRVAAKVDLTTTRPVAEALTFTGPVHVKSGTTEFDCHLLEVDAKTYRCVGTGTAEIPIQIVDDKGSGTCTEIIFNAKSRQVESMREYRATLRR